MRKTAWAAAASCLLAAAGRAGANAPLEFLYLDTGARPAALGGAYAAAADDAEALAYNPAGLAAVKRHEASFTHLAQFSGVTAQSLAVALRQGLGFSVLTVGHGPAQRTTLSNPSGSGLGEFRGRDTAVGAGYGRAVGAGVSLGLGLKYIRSQLDSYSAGAAAVDAGARYRPDALPQLSLGAVAQNMGGTVRFQAQSEELPLELRAGAAYTARWGKASALLAFEAVKPRRGQVEPAAGLEVRPAPTLALRLGYHGRNDAGMALTAGVGASVGSWRGDYAFVPFGALGNAHRLSVSFAWGETR